MQSSSQRTLAGLATLALAVLSLTVVSAGTAAAAPSPPPPAEPGGARVVDVRPLAAEDAPPQVMATANRMINGDGGTSGKCMEIAGGGPSSTYVQMAPCRSYAHQGWRIESAWITVLFAGGTTVTLLAERVWSHDPDAAGRCLTYTGHNVQARMLPCSGINSWWLQLPASRGFFQLESVAAWSYSISTGNDADRKCLDVHVDRTRTTNVVHHWTCGPSNKGNQLFRIQAA